MAKSLIINMLLTILLSCITGCSKSEINNREALGGSPIPGGKFYVATWGDDNNIGSFDEPWETWQKAFSNAEPGDIVYFRGGVWFAKNSSSNNIMTINSLAGIGHSGTSENPICFFNYPGETPIMDCSRVTTPGKYNTGLYINRVNYIHFRGLTIRNVWQKGAEVQAAGMGANDCSNMTFENLTIHSIGGRGFGFNSPVGYFGITSDTTRIINMDVFNCMDTINPSFPGNAGDGIYVNGEVGGYIYLDGCRAFRVSDDGFDVSGNALTVYNNCWSFSNGRKGTEGNGFKFGWTSVDVSPLVRQLTNCIAAGNTGVGFDEANTQPMNLNVFNCVSYNNLYGYMVFASGDQERNNIYRNNISYKDINGNRFLGYVHIGYSSFRFLQGSPHWQINDSITLTDDDFVSLIPQGLSAPRHADGSLPDIDFLKLKKDSDLKGAGINVGMSSSPDIGIDWDYLQRENK